MVMNIAYHGYSCLRSYGGLLVEESLCKVKQQRGIRIEERGMEMVAIKAIGVSGLSSRVVVERWGMQCPKKWPGKICEKGIGSAEADSRRISLT